MKKNVGNTETITLGGFIAMCSIALNRQLMPQTVVLGEIGFIGIYLMQISDLVSYASNLLEKLRSLKKH